MLIVTLQCVRCAVQSLIQLSPLHSPLSEWLHGEKHSGKCHYVTFSLRGLIPVLDLKTQTFVLPMAEAETWFPLGLYDSMWNIILLGLYSTV
jgi:hypothetical protein